MEYVAIALVMSVARSGLVLDREGMGDVLLVAVRYLLFCPKNAQLLSNRSFL